jgi:hypothetical protein
MMDNNILAKPFHQIDLSDPFFDSLKASYGEFEDWFRRKSNEIAYVMEDQGRLVAFLYLKIEEEAVTDIEPILPPARRVKIGTFKINAHGTKLGERFIKRVFDHAIRNGASEVYVTVFREHTPLINLFARYGFTEVATKSTNNGVELVMLKRFSSMTGDIRLDYPIIDARTAKKYVLAIYPQYHTNLFPDSILNNESFDVLSDVSHTNSIHKVYICFMDLSALQCGDVVVIYRTKDDKGPAEHRSVATSVCVVEEIRDRDSFSSAMEYIEYCEPHSVFKRTELLEWYQTKKRLYVLKLTYNAALSKRLTRGILIEEVGLSRNIYWGFFELSDTQFQSIMERGGVDESVIIY